MAKKPKLREVFALHSGRFLAGIVGAVALVSTGALAVAARPAGAKDLSVAWSTKEGDLLFVHDALPAAGGVFILKAGNGLLGLEVATGRRVWSVPDALAERGGFEIVAAGNRIVVVKQNRVSAFAVKTGALLWTKDMPCSFMHGVRAADSTLLGRCSVGLWGDQSVSNASLTAMDLPSGRILWKASQRISFDQYETDGTIVVLSDHKPDHCGPGPCKGSLVAIGATTGNQIWLTEMQEARGQIVLSEQTAVHLSGGIFAYSKVTGNPVWKYDSQGGVADTIANSGHLRPPLVVNDELLIIGKENLQRLSLKTGRIKGSIRGSRALWQRNVVVHAVLAASPNIITLVGGDTMGDGGTLFVGRGSVLEPYRTPCNAQELDSIIGGFLFCQKDDSVTAYLIPGR